MNKRNTLLEYKKKIIVCYVLLMLGTGVWQLADWYFGNGDPLWHLVFYFVVMPVLSFVLGALAGDGQNVWLIPFGSACMSALIYIFMATVVFRLTQGHCRYVFRHFLAPLQELLCAG